jgi:hypothetical protein
MPVEVVGVKDVLKGLSFIDMDMRRRVVAAVDPLMRGVASKAKGFVPANTDVLSGWTKAAGIIGPMKYRTFPKYDAGVAKAGIGYNPGQNKTFSNGFKVYNFVYNASKPGAIYEVAGRLNPQGRAPFQMTPSKGASGTYTLKSPKSKAFREFNSSNPFASQQFIAALPKVTSQPKLEGVRGGNRKTKGRLVYKAWAEDSPRIYQAIKDAINATATHFNKTTQQRVA